MPGDELSELQIQKWTKAIIKIPLETSLYRLCSTEAS